MRVSLDEAARWVAEYEASGMKHRAFADAHGLHYGCIGRYRQRIRRVEGREMAPAMFHELSPIFSPTPVAPPSPTYAACVILPNGYRVEIQQGAVGVGADTSGVALLVQQLAAHQNVDGV